MQTEATISTRFATFDPMHFKAEFSAPRLDMPTFVETTGVTAVSAASDFNPSLFGRPAESATPDFSAVKGAAFGSKTPEVPAAKANLGDFHVTVPTLAEAEQMRLKTSVRGVGHIAVADYMGRQAAQLAAIVEAEAIVRKAFLEFSGDEDDESDPQYSDRHSGKKVLVTA